MERVFNFAPGPSMLPLPVLEQIQKELLCYGSTGMSVMEMSHRSKMYLDIFNQTVADLREVMAIPDHYKVIFPQGGATAMFAAVAMNLMDGGHADYVDSGNFAHNALISIHSPHARGDSISLQKSVQIYVSLHNKTMIHRFSGLYKPLLAAQSPIFGVRNPRKSHDSFTFARPSAGRGITP